MKVVVAGSRTIHDYGMVEYAIKKSGFKITELVSGGAEGVDQLGEIYAKQNDIPIKRFIPDWDKYGRKAGLLRNEEMAKYADAVIVVWDGKSNGTRHMVNQAKKHERQFYGVILKGKD